MKKVKAGMKYLAIALAVFGIFAFVGLGVARDVKINPSNPFELRAVLESIQDDLAAFFTAINANVTDYTAGRAEIVKLVTDLTATRAEVVKLVTDLTATRAEVVKLVTDITAGNTLMGDNKTFVNALRTYLASDGIINTTTLSAGSTPENVATTAFQYLIDGVPYTKAAVTAGTAFTAADTINTGTAAGTYWGIWAVQINAGGTISTKSPGADQTYADEATAIAALPTADAGNVVVGYVTVESNSGAAWTAQTDDLTPASDCTSANFYSTASGIPAAVTNSASGTAVNPAAITATSPAAITASSPAAVTASSISSLNTTDN